MGKCRPRTPLRRRWCTGRAPSRRCMWRAPTCCAWLPAPSQRTAGERDSTSEDGASHGTQAHVAHPKRRQLPCAPQCGLALRSCPAQVAEAVAQRLPRCAAVTHRAHAGPETSRGCFVPEGGVASAGAASGPTLPHDLVRRSRTWHALDWGWAGCARVARGMHLYEAGIARWASGISYLEDERALWWRGVAPRGLSGCSASGVRAPNANEPHLCMRDARGGTAGFSPALVLDVLASFSMRGPECCEWSAAVVVPSSSTVRAGRQGHLQQRLPHCGPIECLA